MHKQQKLDADPNAIKQINFIKNVDRVGNNFHYWKSERNGFRFFKRNNQSITILICFDIILI